MADRDVIGSAGVREKYKDMGDGTYAEVVSLAANPTIDLGDVTVLAGGAIGEVQASPTANTVLDRLKRLETALLGVGVTSSVDFTPAAAAYGAGDIMDVAKQFNFVDRNGVAVPAGSLIRITTAVLKIDVTAVPSGQTNYLLHLYGVTPPSAQADNDAWTLASADLPSYAGSINLGTPADLGAALYVKSQYIDFDIRLGDGLSSLFGRLVTAGAFTATGVVRGVRLHAIVL